MTNYWGMEFVEVVDPKQGEGTRVDGFTHAFLTADGYYERLKEQCYSEQFINVFYQAIVAPMLDYLEQRGIVPEVVSVTWDDEQAFHHRVKLDIDDYGLICQITHRELEQMDYPSNIGRRLAYDMENRYNRKAAQYLYSIMSDSQREYLSEVVESRSFDSMDTDLYLHRHFREFCLAGLIVPYGMYYVPSEQMKLMWRLAQKGKDHAV